MLFCKMFPLPSTKRICDYYRSQRIRENYALYLLSKLEEPTTVMCSLKTKT